MQEVTSMPRRVLPLAESGFTYERQQREYKHLLPRYLSGKDTLHIVEGEDVYTYYSSAKKVRYFYVINEDAGELEYYAELRMADSRGFFKFNPKIYYQSLVWTSPFLAARVRGFAREVIYNVYPQYVNTLLITDRLQTDDGFYMWKKIIFEAIDYGFTSIAYAYHNHFGKKRYLSKLTKTDIHRNFGKLERLFGNHEYHENRGFFITKRPIGEMMLKDIKVDYLPLEEFLDVVADLD